jgi:hypothetical protein
MTQFTCKGFKQINIRISFKYDIHLYHLYLSAFFVSAGVPNGEFPEILIAKTGGTEGTLKIGRTIFCWGEINISCAGDPVHAGDKALAWETPAQRGRVNRYDYTGFSLFLSKFVCRLTYIGTFISCLFLGEKYFKSMFCLHINIRQQ